MGTLYQNKFISIHKIKMKLLVTLSILAITAVTAKKGKGKIKVKDICEHFDIIYDEQGCSTGYDAENEFIHTQSYYECAHSSCCPGETKNEDICRSAKEEMKILKGIKEKGEGKDKKKGNKFCRAFLKLYKKQGCDEKSIFDNSLTDKTGINSESFFKCAKSACCRNSTNDEDSCKQFAEEYWKNVKEKKASKSKDGKKG